MCLCSLCKTGVQISVPPLCVSLNDYLTNPVFLYRIFLFNFDIMNTDNLYGEAAIKRIAIAYNDAQDELPSIP
jgi:hypothetical protein